MANGQLIIKILFVCLYEYHLLFMHIMSKKTVLSNLSVCFYSELGNLFLINFKLYVSAKASRIKVIYYLQFEILFQARAFQLTKGMEATTKTRATGEREQNRTRTGGLHRTGHSGR